MRRTDIDGLRILICAGIIFQHALLIFAAEPIYHLKSVEPWLPASVIYEFLRTTTMEVFFVIAGWSAVTSLRRRGVCHFMKERVARLLVPLVTGIVLFGSIIKYIELRNGRDLGFHGFRLVHELQLGFFEFFPRSLTRMNQLTWSHLWFLLYLFLISILLMPLLVRLARKSPIAVEPRAFVVYLPALSMSALLVAFDGYWPYLPNLITAWNNFAYYALCFAIGAGIAAWPGFETRLHAETPRLLVLMLLAFVGVVLCGESVAGRVFVGLTGWGAVGAALGIAARIKPAATPTLTYLSEATLPVYVVHHVPVLMFGIAVIPLAAPVWLKIAMITVGAAAVSMVAYHCVIRPWPPMRFLMGMPARVSNMAVSSPEKRPPA